VRLNFVVIRINHLLICAIIQFRKKKIYKK
jgi:hypothetical protein